MFGLAFFFTIPENKPPLRGVDAVSTEGGALTAPDPDIEQHRQDQADIVRYLAGETAGFDHLMARYQSRAYGIALSLTGNHDDAMDAMQKSFIRIHRSLDRFRLDEPFFPWLFRIVRNTSLNQKRNEKRHQGACPLEWVTAPDGRADPLAETMAGDLRERLWSAIQDLPAEKRLVFVLHSFEGLKYREIADTLAIPLGTVMSRLHAARNILRRCLESEQTK